MANQKVTNRITRLSRNALIEQFSSGKMPTAKSFEDFIYSTMNLMDDNVNVSKSFGYEIKTQEDGALISFFKHDNIADPLLKIVHKNGEDTIMVVTKRDEPIIQLRADGQVTFPKIKELPLNFNGTIGVESRIGLHKKGQVLADGHYHEILELLEDDIQVFEIVACLKGPKHTGKHAAMHAIAIGLHKHSWFNRIKQTNAFFTWPWNRLKLKWRLDSNGDNGKGSLKLYLKTRSSYWKKNAADDFFKIQYHITRLWDNHIDYH